MDMLELEDAYKVARQYMIDNGYHFDDEEDGEVLHGELEQKVWIGNCEDLNGYIADINPAEICAQIQDDHLSQWCEIMQVEMKRSLKEMQT